MSDIFELSFIGALFVIPYAVESMLEAGVLFITERMWRKKLNSVVDCAFFKESFDAPSPSTKSTEGDFVFIFFSFLRVEADISFNGAIAFGE